MLELLLEGLQLTIVGITIVFVFLGAMVLVVNGMSSLALKYLPEKLPDSIEKEDELPLMAAIAVAIKTRS